MNSEARDSIHRTKEALKTAQQGLQGAANQVENGHVKKEIEEQLNQVTNCLDQCQRIASGLSQYLTEKNFDGIHH